MPDRRATDAAPAPPRPDRRANGSTTLPAVVNTPPLLDPHTEPVPVERRLPEHKGKVGRIADHLGALNHDLREWVELRIQLVKREVMEQIEGRLASVKGLAIVGAIAALGGMFLLVALALLFAALLVTLGLPPHWSYALGFLLVALLFFAAAAVAKRKLAPGAIHVEHDKETGKVRVSHEQTPADAERTRAAHDGRR